MGEYADDIIDQIGDTQWGSRRSPRKYAKKPMCRSCGAKSVKWVKRASGSWVLVDVAGGRHDCKGPVTADSFDDLTKD